MSELQTELMVSQEYYPRMEYEKIYRSDLNNEDWSELKIYADYLRAYCKRVDIEDRPKSDKYYIDLKSFFGIYRFRSGRTLRIRLDPKKIPENKKDQMLNEIVEWLAILGPNLRASLEMLDPFGIIEFELSFSMLLNELTSNLLEEYLPPALHVRTYTSPKILGRIEVTKTMRNLTKGELLFASKRTRVNLQSLPVLFLIKIHFEMLCALDKSMERILKMAKANESEHLVERKTSFALLREMKRSRTYHTDFLTNPLYARLLEKSLETDFEDPFTLEKVRKEASRRRPLLDIIHLWDAYRGKKVPKSQIKDILSGEYNFKPASKLYELWTLKALLDVLSDVFSQKWTARYRNNKIYFHFVDQRSTITLIYNAVAKALYKFKPKSFKLKPDFVLTLRPLRGGRRIERVLLIADAKYKPKPKTSDLERMLAYILTYCWTEPGETANGLFLYIGTKDTAYGRFKDPIKRINPNVRIYSLCLHPDNVRSPKSHLKKILQDILRPACMQKEIT